jgi:hypothetical protein
LEAERIIDLLKYQNANAQPARAVLCLRRWRESRGLGANFREDSQSGSRHRQTTPSTIMTRILAFFHPFFALAARVKGTKIKVTAADKRTSPPTSRSYHVRRMTLVRSVRLLVRFLIKFNL